MIVAFEGPPGAGKTTALTHFANGGYTYVPEMLVGPDEERRFSETDYEAHDRRKHRIAQSLGAASVCLMDRSHLSSAAFRHAAGEPNVLSGTASDLVVPDHYLYFRIDATVSMQRRGLHSDTWRGDDFDFAERVVDFYDQYFSTLPASQVSYINAAQPQAVMLEAAHTALVSRKPG